MALVTIKHYTIRAEAELAKTTLEGAGIPSFVGGVGVSMDGGTGQVQLQVEESDAEKALEVLGDE